MNSEPVDFSLSLMASQLNNLLLLLAGSDGIEMLPLLYYECVPYYIIINFKSFYLFLYPSPNLQYFSLSQVETKNLISFFFYHYLPYAIW